MASLAEQAFCVYAPQNDSEDYSMRYAMVPQPAFTTSPPVGLHIPADAFSSNYPRSSQDVSFAMAFDAPISLYGDASNYMLNSNGRAGSIRSDCSSANNRASPGMYPEDGEMRLCSSSLSTASAPSAASSAIGSPQSHHGQMGSMPDWSPHGLGVQPSIVGNDFVPGPEYSTFPGHGMEELTYEYATGKAGYVDPSLIHSEISRPPMAIASYEAHFQQPNQQHTYSASPSVSSSPQPNLLRTDSSSPFLHNGAFQATFPTSPYAGSMEGHVRRASLGGSNGHFVPATPGEYHSGDETKEKQRCTYPDCGKVFKDLKAHMLTHQNERPEKCPIQTCEYHVKGFARKYDKNRHTLTHYKGTMVCGFCPGSGSAAEKSFNRADVFKRHLTTVHSVEQAPPNSRKKTSTAASSKKLTEYAPDATGKCSTCSQTFHNAQDFYEHLDDCVLRIVQQEDPAEAINAKRLAEVENDQEVHQTLEKNNLPATTETATTEDDEEDMEMGDEDDVDDSSKSSHSPSLAKKKGNPPNGVQKSRGMTHSRGGVTLTAKTRGRKNRRDYPSSWGFDKGQMTMKKRVMAVFDGPRRLAKDDMMLSTDHEVRIKLSDGKSYVTDLDVQTLKRAEGFHNATEDEKGPWISDDPTEEQLKEMRKILESRDPVV